MVYVYHPGQSRPVVVNAFLSWVGGKVLYYAVYRPAYSARGNTTNPVRYKRDTFEKAFRLAMKPL